MDSTEQRADIANPSSRVPRLLKRVAVGLLLLLVVLLGGVFAVHGVFNMCEGKGLNDRAVIEGMAAWSSRWSWLPPGVECTYRDGDGQVRTELLPWSGV